jgi:hypothetical protein
LVGDLASAWGSTGTLGQMVYGVAELGVIGEHEMHARLR